MSKDALFHNEKESARTMARCHVSLEKSSKNYSRCENEKCVAVLVLGLVAGLLRPTQINRAADRAWQGSLIYCSVVQDILCVLFPPTNNRQHTQPQWEIIGLSCVVVGGSIAQHNNLANIGPYRSWPKQKKVLVYQNAHLFAFEARNCNI